MRTYEKYTEEATNEFSKGAEPSRTNHSIALAIFLGLKLIGIAVYEIAYQMRLNREIKK